MKTTQNKELHKKVQGNEEASGKHVRHLKFMLNICNKFSSGKTNLNEILMKIIIC